MKVIGIIPSRFGSSRFPGKPLAILAGKPLVAWVVEAVKKASCLDDVLVATDDERIVAAVEQYGGKAVMTPSELPSGTDRIANAAGDFADDDIICPNLQNHASSIIIDFCINWVYHYACTASNLSLGTKNITSI